MEMLTQTNDRVLNICYACGFNNINHFNRIFKSIVGVSPTVPFCKPQGSAELI